MARLLPSVVMLAMAAGCTADGSLSPPDAAEGSLADLSATHDLPMQDLAMQDLAMQDLAMQDLPPSPCQPECGPGGECRRENDQWTCVYSCAANADCRGDPKYFLCCGGRCVDGAGDQQNCGQCGHVCFGKAWDCRNKKWQYCFNGWCALVERFTDCDCNPANGLEADVTADFMNCGECGHVCPGRDTPGALPACRNGVCDLVCRSGRLNCNNDWLDGCEVDATGIANCGACNRACPAPPHATAACDLMGQCGFRCDLGWGDCDGAAQNGCEVDVNADASNCGHCGNVCGVNRSCVGGRCQ